MRWKITNNMLLCSSFPKFSFQLVMSLIHFFFFCDIVNLKYDFINLNFGNFFL